MAFGIQLSERLVMKEKGPGHGLYMYFYDCAGIMDSSRWDG